MAYSGTQQASASAGYLNFLKILYSVCYVCIYIDFKNLPDKKLKLNFFHRQIDSVRSRNTHVKIKGPF